MTGSHDEKQAKRLAAAARAKQEAQERRAKKDRQTHDGPDGQPKEIDGRGGLDPVRYSDWEIKGLTSDF